MNIKDSKFCRHENLPIYGTPYTFSVMREGKERRKRRKKKNKNNNEIFTFDFLDCEDK